MMKVYLEGMVGKYLVYLNQNKTTCAYITNNAFEVSEKLQCLKQSALRDTQPSFNMCIIECVVVSMLEFTVNEATTSNNKTYGRQKQEEGW